MIGRPSVARPNVTACVAMLIALGCSEASQGGNGVAATGGNGSEQSTPNDSTSGEGGSSKRADHTTSPRNATGGSANTDEEASSSGGSSDQGGDGSEGQTSSKQAGGGRSASSTASTKAGGGTQPSGGAGNSLGGSTNASNTAVGTSNASSAQANGGSTASGTSSTSTKPPSYGGGGAASLREKYADYFPMGAAVDSQSYNSHSALLKQHFNSITLENEMKFDALQSTEGNFTYATADAIVSFASSNNMKVRGHALVWHRQVPSWVFASRNASEVLKKMKSHITNVMKHFEKSVYAWDVVNEAIMDDGSFRNGEEEKEDQRSQWYEVVGESYIGEAFRYAREAVPSAKLFYNDYYNYLPARRTAIYNLLKGLLADGVPIDGVGLQAHFNIEPSAVTTNQAYYQHVEELEEAIKLYSSLGLEVQITEMDVSLYIPGITYNADTFYTTATFTEGVQAKQAERYREFFNLYREYKDVITGVTLWGVADDNTWLSEFSSGRKDFPLLFDVNKKQKKAYYAVVDF